jgi:hypothetical protein
VGVGCEQLGPSVFELVEIGENYAARGNAGVARADDDAEIAVRQREGGQRAGGRSRIGPIEPHAAILPLHKEIGAVLTVMIGKRVEFLAITVGGAA